MCTQTRTHTHTHTLVELFEWLSRSPSLHKVKLCVKFVGHVSTSVDNCFCPEWGKQEQRLRCLLPLKRVSTCWPALQSSSVELQRSSSCACHTIATQQFVSFSALAKSAANLLFRPDMWQQAQAAVSERVRERERGSGRDRDRGTAAFGTTERPSIRQNIFTVDPCQPAIISPCPKLHWRQSLQTPDTPLSALLFAGFGLIKAHHVTHSFEIRNPASLSGTIPNELSAHCGYRCDLVLVNWTGQLNCKGQ